ncbi:MAG: class I SAM-dependent methyltransferase, partial [Mycobacteriales bacterium]
MPEDDSRRHSAAHFQRDDIAQVYRARLGYAPEAIHYALRQAHWHRLRALQAPDLPETTRPLRILDAGAGTGQVTQAIKACEIPAEIIALDSSASMLREYRADHPDVPSVRGDIDRLPFADDTFDVVMFGKSLHWGNPELTPREVRRVLRPGGALVSLNGAIRGGTDLAQAVFSELPSALAENPMTSAARRGGPLSLGDGFLPSRQQRFDYYDVMTPAQVRDLLGSLAMLARAPEDVQARIREGVEAF